jgi:RNA processing factor Prp31
MAQLSLDELYALEKPDRPKVTPIPAKTIEDIEAYIKGLPDKANRVYEIELVEGYSLDLSEKELNDLIRSNRHYKEIMSAVGQVTNEPKKVESKDLTKKFNSKILTADTFSEATQTKSADVPNGADGTSAFNAPPPLSFLNFLLGQKRS